MKTITLHLGKSSTVKTTVTLPQPLVDELKEYAASEGISFSEAVNQALELEQYVRDHLKDGGAIYLKKEPNAPMIKLEIIR